MNDQYKTLVQNAFDTVCKGYDHSSLPFFPETASRILQHMELDDHCKLLDICTGTGVVALKAAQQLKHSQITGIDLSSGMLNKAREKAKNMQLHNIEFTQMDLDHLTLNSNHFDAAISSFGLFFLQDMQHALKNILATLKHGGKIAISSFTDGAFDPFSSIFLQRYESFGKEIPPLSWKRLANKENINALFRSVGIHQVEYHYEPLGHHLKNEQHWWDIVWNAGYRGLLNQLTPEEQQLYEQQHRKEIAELCTSGNTWLNTGVIIAIAHKT